MTLETIMSKFGGDFRVTSMRDNDYDDNGVFWLEFQGATCPICGHQNWCVTNVTGTKVICMRESGNTKYKSKKLRNGTLYFLGNDKSIKIDLSKISKVKTLKKAHSNILDLMYRGVLSNYSLTHKHLEDLHRRGLTNEMIKLHGDRGFGSYYERDPKNRLTIPQVFIRRLEDGLIGKKSIWEQFLKDTKDKTHNAVINTDLWKGVPGFYQSVLDPKKEGLTSNPEQSKLSYPIFEATEGLLVPYYDELNRLIGFQSRVDNVKKKLVIVSTYSVDYNGNVTDYGNTQNKQYYVDFNSKNGNYSIYFNAKGCNENNFEKASKMFSGNAFEEKSKEFTIEDKPFGYKLKLEEGGKYFWVSSGNKNYGTHSGSPVQVAYNPKIARLNPSNKADFIKIKKYTTKKKSIWLTEGGLKAIVAANYLPAIFSNDELEKYGRDVLGVAGVNSYAKFIPMLKKLNVRTVTTAYDMDFIENKQVMENYRKMLIELKKNGIQVRIAHWDGSKAKGIDDALVKGLDISFRTL
ncbi:DUF3854 domain-containing protein [Lactobacillus sp. PV037]|uniref:DUF3854 domain-containing protein n=1 Tax=Lactobacillus sp. PV037 TaxID=2594496 RepID=UPI00223F30B2|nr:DUF3854 domain-containing protein [Lactobacillus sp. PV037]